MTLDLAEATLYCDDVVRKQVSIFKSGTLTAGIDEDDDAVFAELLGKTVDEKTGVVISNVNVSICAHFKGSGWLIFSSEPDRKYKARVANQIEFSHVIRHFKRFAVEFEMQPFGYDIFEQTITKTAPFNLFNIGTFEAEPIITIFGNGNITLYVNSQSNFLNEIAEKIIIDSEMKNAYNNSISLNYKMSSDFPILSLGENNISWTGNVTKLEIQPNWRYL